MTGVPKNYIAVMARPQPPRNVAWRAEANAVVLSWAAPPHHKEIKGYLVYRGQRSGDGYRLLTAGPVAGTRFRDPTIDTGVLYYYVIASLEHSGLESGYSAEASRAGVKIPKPADDSLVVYAEAEDALVDLASGDKPGISRGRDRLGASNWYYIYTGPTTNEGAATVPVSVSIGGDYVVWVRVRSAPGAERASWAATIDGEALGSFPCPSEKWTWVKAATSPVRLVAGPHGLTLIAKDAQGAGAQADMVCLATDMQFIPKGPRPEDRQPGSRHLLSATALSSSAGVRIVSRTFPTTTSMLRGGRSLRLARPTSSPRLPIASSSIGVSWPARPTRMP